MRRQFLMIIIARGLGSLLQAVLLVAYARAVDPAVFGLTNALLGIAAIASVVFDLGITTYIVRIWAFEGVPEKVAVALKIARWTSVAVGIIFSSIFAFGSVLGQAPWHLGLIAIWIALEKNVESYLSIHIAKQDVVRPAVSIMIRRIVPLAIYLALSILGYDGVTALIVALCAGGALGQLHVSLTLPLEIRSASTRIPMFSIIRKSRSFGIANLASQLRNADVFIVTMVAGLIAGGSFAAATKLTIPIYLVASALSSAVMPAIAKVGHAGVGRIAVGLYGALGLGVGGIFLIRPWLDALMVRIFGEEYQGAGQLLFLILLGTIVASVGFPVAALLQSVGLSSAVARIEGATAILVLAGIITGTLASGVEGGATAALCAQLVRAVWLSLRLFIWKCSLSRSLPVIHKEGAIR